MWGGIKFANPQSTNWFLHLPWRRTHLYPLRKDQTLSNIRPYYRCDNTIQVLQKSASSHCAGSCKSSLCKADVTMKWERHRRTNREHTISYAISDTLKKGFFFPQSHECFLFETERSCITGFKQTRSLFSARKDKPGWDPDRAAATRSRGHQGSDLSPRVHGNWSFDTQSLPRRPRTPHRQGIGVVPVRGWAAQRRPEDERGVWIPGDKGHRFGEAENSLLWREESNNWILGLLWPQERACPLNNLLAWLEEQQTSSSVRSPSRSRESGRL